MADNDDMSSLFPIFILSVMGLFTVPWTIYRISSYAGSRKKNLNCRCSECMRAPKNRVSFYQKVWRFLTLSNIALVSSWLIIIVLFYYIKISTRENQPFDPFLILGLEASASEADIKKAYRRLSVLYHPDKNPDPAANNYFVEFITKAYQALTDPVSRENFAKYGHPDGRQGMQMGIALPKFLLDIHGAAGGLLLIAIVGIGILLPLVGAVWYLRQSSKFTGNYVMHHTISSYYRNMKQSLAPSKVLEVLIQAAEFVEIPVRHRDEAPLQRLFLVVRSELNLDPKNLKTEQLKFWKKKHPAFIKAELLILAHLSRQHEEVLPEIKADFDLVMSIVPRLMEELMKMALMPRTAEGYGWLRPALSIMEFSQSLVQAVPLSARKVSERAANSGGSPDGIAPFLQLPHFTENVVKKLGRKKVRTFQELRDLPKDERAELLKSAGGFTDQEAEDVEAVLEMMPNISVEVTCTTEGEEGIQEGDIVTMTAWITLHRNNGLIAAHPHAPYFPQPKDELYWLLLGDQNANCVWVKQRITFMDEATSAAAASKIIGESMEGTGADDATVNKAVREAVERVKSGSRLVMEKFQAPAEGTYKLTCFCLCDTWLGCDRRVNVTLKVGKRSRPAIRPGVAPAEGVQYLEDGNDDAEEDEEEADEDYDSEYSDEDDQAEEEVKQKPKNENWIKEATANLLEKEGDDSSSSSSESDNENTD
ncbi:hypothetical protein R1sor_014543 [Riccia sorocarpa]|uniref:J domain-containing protein n=1 Tax=Riccia sorocarpa TaxID=122646 RepID=A0ABD3HFT5_9MARC